MEVFHLLGRTIFGLFFIYNGVNHFRHMEGMKQYAASKGVAAPGVAVPATGVMLLAGGASVVLGLWPVVGLWLLILFLVPTAIIMHDFWAVSEEERMPEMIQFSKDIALAGAALALLWGASTGWPLAVTG